MKDKDYSMSGHMRNFGISALIAAIILLAGVLFGVHFIFGFGVLMLAIVGILSMIAIVEYVLGLI